MKRFVNVVASLCLGLFAQNALADQSAYVSKREASVKVKVKSVGIQNVTYPDNNGQPQYE